MFTIFELVAVETRAGTRSLIKNDKKMKKVNEKKKESLP